MSGCGLCDYCKGPLLSWDEQEYGVCDDCAEILIERSNKTREWGEYHDEPCPEIELPPMPKASS
jgi:hypothetical protein